MEKQRINDIQIGGSHYDKTGEQHWDRAWRLKYDFFQYQITKYVERWKAKNGLEDLKKAQHFMNKYVELIESEYQAKEVDNTGDYVKSSINDAEQRKREQANLMNLGAPFAQKIPDRF